MTFRRDLPAVLVLLGIVLAVWILAGRGRDLPEAAQHEAREDAPAAAPALRGTGTERAKEADTQEAERSVPTDRPVRDRSAELRVKGTVRYEDGTHPSAFAFTLFHPTGPNRGAGWAVKGKDGAFEGPAVAPGHYAIRRMRADGGEPHVVTPSVRHVAGQHVEIVIRRGRSSRLLVLDVEDGSVLPEAKAYRGRGSWQIPPIGTSNSAHLPGAATRGQVAVTADVAGVILLPPMDGVTHWLVGAPDHAWRQVAVPADAEGTVTVRLAAGGTAVVKVPDLDCVKDPVLIADRREQLPDLVTTYGFGPRADDSGTFRIEGLPEGYLTFAVGKRIGFVQVGDVYATGRVEIRRGTEAHLTLFLELGPQPNRVVLRGTLRIPAEWQRTRTSPYWLLFFRGVSDDPSSRGHRAKARLNPGAHALPTSFETDAVPEGAYELLLKPPLWTHRVVARAGMVPLDIVVPPPVQVRVRVVSKATGDDLGGATVCYAPTTAGQRSWRWQAPEVDPRTGEHILRCPASTVRLEVTAPGHQRRTEDIDPPEAPTSSSFVVELAEAGAIRMHLRHGARPVSAKGVRIWVSSIDSGRGGLGKGDVLELDGLAPGAWRLKVKKIAGYRLPEERMVAVTAKETVTVTIDLESE